MTKIYEQHRAAFASVSAFVVMRGAERVATIAFKFPRDGAGRLYAYVHWLGEEMQRGRAAGGGYDKKSAAAASAVRRIKRTEENAAFIDALGADNGFDLDRNLRSAGFTLFQAV